MKMFSEETRKRMSESAKRRCNNEWRLQKSSAYETKLDTELIKNLYESGMTQVEIANKLNVTQKIIWKHMRNHGIVSRKAAKRNQFGKENHMWRGNGASYSAFHQRVINLKGKASEHGCSVCGRKDAAASYDWANLTGKYEDINDYKPMCRSCHRKYDKARRESTLSLGVIECQY